MAVAPSSVRSGTTTPAVTLEVFHHPPSYKETWLSLGGQCKPKTSTQPTACIMIRRFSEDRTGGIHSSGAGCLIYMGKLIGGGRGRIENPDQPCSWDSGAWSPFCSELIAPPLPAAQGRICKDPAHPHPQVATFLKSIPSENAAKREHSWKETAPN